MSRFELFDRTRIQLGDLRTRGHDLVWTACSPLCAPAVPFHHPHFPPLLDKIRTARSNGRPVVLMMGAHPIKLGLSRFLVDLVERGFLTHVATNGGGLIHDFELALAGGTSEDVARWIKDGQFGLWRETGRLNDFVRRAAENGEGAGEGVGRVIEEESLPHRDLSLAAACWRAGIPFTCHVGVGSDIIHAHANCDGAALGQTSLTDFLIFARTIQDLEGGVFLNMGTAVTGPEIYLKALSMARNVARQSGRETRRFTTAVFDLVPLPAGWREGTASKEEPLYYYRPWKTVLVRTVADGGASYYFQADHRLTIPSIWQGLAHTADPSVYGARHGLSLPVDPTV